MIDYKGYIKKIIKDACPDVGDIEVVRPPKEEMGDFSVATFTLNINDIKNPAEKAKYLKDILHFDNEYIDSVNTIGPYLNFVINKDHLANQTIKNILNAKKTYGALDIGKGDNLLIEHTSINPNASPHIGRARNGIIGDFLARLFRFIGYNVETHYFVNDIGKQISMLIVGVEEFGDMENITFEKMLDLYIRINEESKTNPQINTKVMEYLNKIEHGDKEVIDKFKKIIDICVQGQQKIFKKIGIKFDVFTYESDFVFNNATNDVLKKIKETGTLKEDENGRFYVDLSGYNIPTKNPVIVLTREDKTSLYPLRDIAYTIYKINLNPKNNYIVLGEDQEVYMMQVSAVMDILGYPAPQLISYSFVLLDGDKMTTREGKVVLLEDLIEKIKDKIREIYKERDKDPDENKINDLAASCIKYNMLNVNRKKSVNFNLEEATNFQGNSAIYLLYNYARINSILEKVEDLSIPDKVIFNDELEYSLINDLYDFPEIVKSTYETKESVIMTKYLYELAHKFSKYYKFVPILDEKEKNIKESKLVLLKCIKTVLENGFNILGINAVKNL